MLNDKRKAERRALRYTAWIQLDGEVLQGCALADISDTGARLEVENATDLPDTFVLLLSSRGSPKRKCHVVWRADEQIGVKFDRKLPEAKSKKKAAAIDSPPIAPEPDEADALPETEAAEKA